MTYVLTARERKLMSHLQIDHETFQVPGQLPVGTGKLTLERLTGLGLLEVGPGRWGDPGWRLTDDGWRSMYGKTNDEMMKAEGPYHALKVWSWPPTPNTNLKVARPRPQLSNLPPRLAELPPRLRILD